jgi:peptidoglycan/LPS O-acetylase OafA/YrhL
VPVPAWRAPNPLGRTESIRSMGSTTGTLLGGFSLATVALLVTAERQPPLVGWALIAFVLAAAAFVFSVQFTSAALGFAATPAERLMWAPAAERDPQRLARLQRIQRMDQKLEHRFARRARWCYRLGLFAFLGGIVLICIPDTLDWPRITAAALAGAAMLLELVWVSANALDRTPRWLLPSYTDPGIWEDLPNAEEERRDD